MEELLNSLASANGNSNSNSNGEQVQNALYNTLLKKLQKLPTNKRYEMIEKMKQMQNSMKEPQYNSNNTSTSDKPTKEELLKKLRAKQDQLHNRRMPKS